MMSSARPERSLARKGGRHAAAEPSSPPSPLSPPPNMPRRGDAAWDSLLGAEQQGTPSSATEPPEVTPFRPFVSTADSINGDTEIDVPVAWLLLLLLICCFGCWCRRQCRRRQQQGRANRQRAGRRGSSRDLEEDEDGDDDDDNEIDSLVRRVKRIVGYEVLANGKVEYSCIDNDGEEVTLSRRDLMDGGEAEQMVRAYEARYPPPWAKTTKSGGSSKAPSGRRH